MPALTGINMAVVPQRLKALASGCTVAAQNVLGYALGAQLPGLAMDLSPGLKAGHPAEDAAIGFSIVVLWPIFGVAWLTLASWEARREAATTMMAMTKTSQLEAKALFPEGQM